MPQASHVVGRPHQAQARLQQGAELGLVVDEQAKGGLQLAPVDADVGRVQERPWHVVQVHELAKPGHHFLVGGEVLAVGVAVAGKDGPTIVEGIKEGLAA